MTTPTSVYVYEYSEYDLLSNYTYRKYRSNNSLTRAPLTENFLFNFQFLADGNFYILSLRNFRCSHSHFVSVANLCIGALKIRTFDRSLNKCRVLVAAHTTHALIQGGTLQTTKYTVHQPTIIVCCIMSSTTVLATTVAPSKWWPVISCTTKTILEYTIT